MSTEEEERSISKPESQVVSDKKPTLKERLKDHFAEYGTIAFIIYLSISALTILGFYIAISTGFSSDESSGGAMGTLFAAWLAAKLTLPLRIGATFILTPIAAALYHKFRGTKKPPKASSD